MTFFHNLRIPRCLFLWLILCTGWPGQAIHSQDTLSIAYWEMPAGYFSNVPIDSLLVNERLPELEARYGKNKICVERYRDKLLAALVFFPELSETAIRVKSKRIKTSMAVRPHKFAFSRNNRGYTIYVDDQTEDKPVDFRKASYSAQVGCFIHELAHIVYYERRSNVTLLRTGLGYTTSLKFRSRFEKAADQIAIEHGGGFYVYQFATFIFEKADISEEYRQFKEDNYYSNEEILRLHRAHVKRNKKKKTSK